MSETERIGVRLDREVDAVLAALGGVELTPGLEARVLARLESSPRRARLGLWAPACACACVALLVGVVWMGRLPKPQTDDAGVPAVARISTPAADAAAVRHLSTDVQHEEGRDRDQSQVPLQRHGRRASDAMGDLARAEMMAPSVAAAEPPLTRQERLLERAAQTRGVAAIVAGDELGGDADLSGELRMHSAAKHAQPQSELLAAFGQGIFAGIRPVSNDE